MTRRTIQTSAVLALLALAGCGGGGGDSTSESSKGETATPTATAKPDAGVATVEYKAGYNLDGYRVRIDSLRREGPFMTLNATIDCVAPADTDCYTQKDFTLGPFDNNVFSGPQIVDPAGQRLYQVVRDGTGELGEQPYTSALEPSLAADAQPVRAWARYAAPPADVTTVDVLLPEGGPRIPDVPITEGGVDTDALPGTTAAQPAEFPLDPASQDATGLQMGDDDIIAETQSRQRRTQDRRGRRLVTLAADVLFDFDSARIDAEGRQTLQRTGEQIAADADGAVAIDGYTDSKGSDAYNLRLSRQRAEAVQSALLSTLSDRKLAATGHGEADPVAPNTVNGADNPAGRRKNRRVTVGYALARKPTATAQEDEDAASAPPQAPSPVTWQYDGAADEVSSFEATVLGVRRVGNLSVLEMDVTCTQSDADDCDQQFALAADGSSGNDAGGIVVTDPAEKVTYSPATFSQKGGYDSGQPTIGTTVKFKPGEKRRIETYFAAIPASTQSLTVAIPGGGPTVEGVPVL